MAIKMIKISMLAVILFFVGTCSQIIALEVGEEASDFKLKDIDENMVSLSEFKGKVIILDFFASWCPPCREEVPGFIALQKSYGNKGFAMIAVALVTRSEAKEFAEKEGINYPVLIDDEMASITYGPIRSIPTTYIIDKDFKIAKVYIGYRPKATFENDIRQLLK